LDKCGIRYVIVGGVALNLYGIPRTTVDLDLFVDLEEGNLKRFLECMEGLGLRLLQPVDKDAILDSEERGRLRDEKNAIVLTFFNPKDPTETVDFFIDEILPFGEVYGRRRVLEGEGYRVSLISLEDLIRLKELSGREKDLYDLNILRRIKDGAEG